MAKHPHAALAGLLLAVGATSLTACGRRALSDAAGHDGGAGSGGGAGSSSADGAAGATSATLDASVDARDAGGATLADGTCAHNAFVRDGVCTCTDSTPTVCGDTCVDLATDDDHCGDCAIACAVDTTCVDKLCGVPPGLVGEHPLGPGCGDIDLALANGTMYWAEEGRGDVGQMDPVTGRFAAFAATEKAPTRLSVRGNNVFWLDTATRTLRQKRGDAAVTDAFVSATAINGYVASADGASLYYSTEMEIDEVDALGGAPVRVASFGTGGPTALALDGTTLVALEDVTGFVDAATLVPGRSATCEVLTMEGMNASINCVRLGQSNGSLFQDLVLLARGHAVWADGTTLNLSGSTTAYSKLGLASANDPVSGFVALGDTIYFATSDPLVPNRGIIYKVSLGEDQVAVPLARGQLAPRSLVADSRRLYWSTGDCAIKRLDL